MTRFNGNRREVRAYRQLEVSRLRVKGLSLREIQDSMAAAGQTNPLTGEPWSLGVIQRDCRDLEVAWLSEAAADIAAAKGLQLAEIREARRVAWGLVDVNQVRQLIKLEMELLGTEAARMFEVGGRAGGPIEHAYTGVTDEHLITILAALGQGALAAVGREAGHDDPGGAPGEDSEGEEES